MSVVYPWKLIIIALVINTLFLYCFLRLLKDRKLHYEQFPKRKRQAGKKFIIILFLIIAIGFSIRVWKLRQEEFETQELSHLFPLNEEISSLFTTSPVNIKNIIFHPANLYFGHQPLTPILLYFLALINKSVIPEEFLFRLPSVLFGIATIWILFLLTKELFDEKTALLSSFLFALSPFHLYYSRSLEPYSTLCFFTVVSYYLFVLIAFRNRYSLFPVYLILLIIAFFFHYLALFILISHIFTLLLCLCFREWSKYKKYLILCLFLLPFDHVDILMLVSCYVAILLFFYKNKEREWTSMERNLSLFTVLMNIFGYVIILWFPYIAYTFSVGHVAVFERSYIYLPLHFSDILFLPVKLFQTTIGISPNNFVGAFLVLFTFVYFFIYIKRKDFSTFVTLLSGIPVLLFITFCFVWRIHHYTKGFYEGLYRHNILILPLLYIVMAYGVNLICVEKLFFKKVKVLILTAGILTLFINNIKMDYNILTQRQKPSYSESLLFINEFVQKGDMIFFPLHINPGNFLYYFDRHSADYKQILYEVLKQNYSPINISGFSANRDSIPNYITEFKSNYKRMWVIVARDEILEREVFNLSYPNVLLNYLSENFALVLTKKFRYIDIYLFQLS